MGVSTWDVYAALLHRRLCLQSTGQWMTCRYFRGSSALVLLVVLLHCTRGTRVCMPKCLSSLIFQGGDVCTVVLSNYFTFPFIYFGVIFGAVVEWFPQQ